MSRTLLEIQGDAETCVNLAKLMLLAAEGLLKSNPDAGNAFAHMAVDFQNRLEAIVEGLVDYDPKEPA